MTASAHAAPQHRARAYMLAVYDRLSCHTQSENLVVVDLAANTTILPRENLRLAQDAGGMTWRAWG